MKVPRVARIHVEWGKPVHKILFNKQIWYLNQWRKKTKIEKLKALLTYSPQKHFFRIKIVSKTFEVMKNLHAN